MARDERLGGHVQCLCRVCAHIEVQDDGAVLARRRARAVFGVLDRGGVARDERHHTEPVRQELVGEHRVVVLDLDEVDGDRRHVGDDGAAQRVGEREVDARQQERKRPRRQRQHGNVAVEEIHGSDKAGIIRREKGIREVG